MNKQDILEKIDIVDVISEYIELERKGKNYFGVCPFHNDNNPSMSVSFQKQMYKCFSCGAGGDALNFVMNYENISFQDAMAKLASMAGVDYKVNNSYNEIKDPYYNIYKDSTKYFAYSLVHSTIGEKYLRYLTERGFSLELIEHFQIGCSSKDLVSLLESKYKSADIVKTGIVNANKNLIFKSRIVFPIADKFGNVIGYSGRVIDDATPKYLNTPETKYFKKSEILYNMHLAKPEISKSKSVIITEGFFDVMRLYDNDIKNVVATMGTAFTSSHVSMIKELASSIYICMDSDDAGKKASATMYSMLKDKGTKIYMVNLDDLDPDEYVLKFGIDKFKTKLSTSKLYEEYYVDLILDKYVDKDVSSKEQALELTKKFISSIDSQVTRQLINDYIFELTGINVVNVNYNRNTQVNTRPKGKHGKSVVESYYNLTIEQNDVINKIELEFLYLMLNDRNAIELYEKDIHSMNILQNDEVAMLIKQFYIQNEYTDIIEYFNHSYDDYNEQQKKVITDILNSIQLVNLNCDEITVNDYVGRIVLFKYEKRIEAMNKRIVNEADKEIQRVLLKKLNILIKEKTDIIERRGM